jgi:hypothetical protein
MTGNLSYVPKQKDDLDWGTSWHVGKISNIAEAVGRADLVLIAAHDMLSSTNSPWNYQGPFWLPVIDWGYGGKNGGGANEAKMA